MFRLPTTNTRTVHAGGFCHFLLTNQPAHHAALLYSAPPVQKRSVCFCISLETGDPHGTPAGQTKQTEVDVKCAFRTMNGQPELSSSTYKRHDAHHETTTHDATKRPTQNMKRSFVCSTLLPNIQLQMKEARR